MLLLILLSCTAEGPSAAAPPDGPVLVDLPVWGGNLLVRDDGSFVATDPEADLVWTGALVDGGLDVASHHVPGAPWRIASAGDATWISLRHAGQVLRLEDGLLRDVCSDPRGLWADDEGLGVACRDGTLVVLDAEGTEQERHHLPDDLRDVVRVGGAWWLTRFRGAELVVFDGEDHQVEPLPAPEGWAARVAWRMVADADGAWFAHQRAPTTPVDLGRLDAPPYGSEACDGVVGSVVTHRSADGTVRTTGPLARSVLPVDVAPAESGVWLASAGADGLSDVGVAWLDPSWLDPSRDCALAPGVAWSALGPGRVSAAAPLGDGLLVVLAAPFGLVFVPGDVAPEATRPPRAVPRGAERFHAAPLGTIACASCHPEGADDGHTWLLSEDGGVIARRTQSLAGGHVPHTEPLHWAGDLPHLDALLEDTFVRRMGGELLPGDADALGSFLAELPAVEVGGGPDDLLVRHGCDDCHGGPWRTDGLAHDVGTGEALQTPSLVGLGARGPWMHDGCAIDLLDRFDPACGGDRHGNDVPAEELPALVEQLRGL